MEEELIKIIIYCFPVKNASLVEIKKIQNNKNPFLIIQFKKINSSILPPPYFYQFLHFLIFINSSSSLFLSISPLPYFHYFLYFLIFINSSTLFLSIPPPPYFYQFLLFLIFIISCLFLSIPLPYFISFSFSLFLSIPP